MTQLTGGASGTLTYDTVGSLLSDPSGATYTCSALGALQTSTLGGQTVGFQAVVFRLSTEPEIE